MTIVLASPAVAAVRPEVLVLPVRDSSRSPAKYLSSCNKVLVAALNSNTEFQTVFLDKPMGLLAAQGSCWYDEALKSIGPRVIKPTFIAVGDVAFVEEHRVGKQRRLSVGATVRVFEASTGDLDSGAAEIANAVKLLPDAYFSYFETAELIHAAIRKAAMSAAAWYRKVGEIGRIVSSGSAEFRIPKGDPTTVGDVFLITRAGKQIGRMRCVRVRDGIALLRIQDACDTFQIGDTIQPRMQFCGIGRSVAEEYPETLYNDLEVYDPDPVDGRH